MIGCIILTHGDMGYGLMNTVEGIMGKQEGFSVVSNIGLGRDELASALQTEIRHEEYTDGVIVFVDMFGTSCWQTARKAASRMASEKSRIAVITGVNLPMLVKFFSMRNSTSLPELVRQVRQEGEKGIKAES